MGTKEKLLEKKANMLHSILADISVGIITKEHYKVDDALSKSNGYDELIKECEEQ